MGEIADMIIDGTLDWQTGEYLGEGYGYPRTFGGRGIHDWNPNIGRVNDILKARGFTQSPKNRKNSKSINLLKRYLTEKRADKDRNVAYGTLCNIIVNHYLKDFKLWMKTKYGPKPKDGTTT